MVSRCTCGFTVDGPAGEAREEMRAHRRKAHPERPVVAKRPTPPPKPRPTPEAIAEGKRLQREARAARRWTAPRGSGKRGRRPYSRLSDALVRELHVRYMAADERIGSEPLIAAIWRDLGYASIETCGSALRARWHKLGLHVRPAGGYRGPLPGRCSGVTDEQFAVVRQLWAAGARTSRIAALCWREWGYSSPKGLEQGLIRFARRLPEDERPILRRGGFGPKRWVGSIPEDEARRMLLVATAAA